MRQKLAKCSFLGKPSHIYQSHSASRLVLHSAYLNSKNKPWSHSCTKYFHKSECKQIQARCHIFQKTARPVMAKLIFYSSEFCYCTSDSLTYLASPLSLSCSEVSSFEPLSFLLACSGSCSLHSNIWASSWDRPWQVDCDCPTGAENSWKLWLLAQMHLDMTDQVSWVCLNWIFGEEEKESVTEVTFPVTNITASLVPDRTNGWLALRMDTLLSQFEKLDTSLWIIFKNEKNVERKTLHLRTNRSVDANLLLSQRKGKVKARGENNSMTPRSVKKEGPKPRRKEGRCSVSELKTFGSQGENIIHQTISL